MLNWRDIKNPEAGGSEKHLHEIGSRWARAGHEITLFSSSFVGAPTHEIVDGVNICREGNRFTIYPATIKRLMTKSASHEYDVIFESINTIPFFSPLFSKTPVVAEIYSIENKSVLIREIRASMIPAASIAYLLSSAIPGVYNQCEITTISTSSKAALMKEGFDSNRIHVAYPGLSDSWMNLVKNPQWIDRPNNSIVYLGRLKKYKGVQDILNAIPLVRKTIPEIRLKIIGKGDYEPALREIVNSLGIQHNIEFCGFVSEQEKARILNQASLYICTSLDEGGWTIAAIEAMSAGLPVLVTKSQADILNGGLTGRLLRNEKSSEIAEKVITLLQDRFLWSELSKNALEFSRKFNWDSAASVTLEALRKASCAH